MSPTSYQTAPPRISMVTYRTSVVNFSTRFFFTQFVRLSSNGSGDMLECYLMATTHTRSAPTSGLPYYVWEVPEKLTIQLYFDVIDHMYPDIMRGLGALRRRGAEVGGILLGR